MSSQYDETISEVLDAGRLLSTATVMFHTAVAEASGLSVTETKAMEIIQRKGPLTPADLARESGLAPASVTALVDRLSRKGVARRLPHPSDKRRILVEIDPGYEARNAVLFDEFVERICKLCREYEPGQLRLIAAFMTAAAQCQQDATARLTSRNASDRKQAVSARQSTSTTNSATRTG